MKKFIRLNIYFMIACWLFVAHAMAQPSLDAAEAFINKLGKDTITMIRDNAIKSHVKEEQLNALFTRNVNTSWMAKFVLGRHWRTIDDQQKKEFAAIYSDFLKATYVPHFRRYTGEAFVVIGGKTLSEREFIISTEIKNQEEGSSYQVDYRLRCDGESHFKIYDIIAEGISLITTQRSEFGSVVENKGVDYLIEQLREKERAARNAESS